MTDLNDDPDGCPIVGGSLATTANYEPPVYIAVRMKVAPKGGTYWTSLVSYSPNGWMPENDAFEFECTDSKSFTTSTHRLVNGEHKMPMTRKFKFPVDLSEDFHIYSASIYTNGMVTYLDNVQILDYTEAGMNVEPFYFMIENQIFQNANPKLISPENLKKMFPMAAIVDWIKIYKP